jgi:hypothetical protein
MERLSQAEAQEALAWLETRGLSGLTGYDASGWPAALWIPHAMYETDQLPSGLTHDEMARIERASGIPSVPSSGDDSFDARLAELVEGATLIGGALGASANPGEAWRRLLWSELASRLEVDPYATGVPPCFRSFPYTSWPANIAPPAEGSLDRDQFLALAETLGANESPAQDTMCFAYRCPVSTGEFDDPLVYRCRLHELADLYDQSETGYGAPNNVWPDDLSWFTYTDADLWATKLSGNEELIAKVRAELRIESVELPF